MPFIWPYFPPFSDALPAEPPTLPLAISKKTAKALCLSFERRILLPLAMAIARPNDKVLGHVADYERKDHTLYPWRVSFYLRRSFFFEGGGNDQFDLKPSKKKKNFTDVPFDLRRP